MAQVVGNSDSGWAVWGGSNSGTGVVGTAGTGVGTFGQSTNSYGVWGRSSNSAGVVGDTTAFESPAVWGNARGRGPGVVGTAGGVSRAGVFGHHTQAGNYGVGVHGKVSYPPPGISPATGTGVKGEGPDRSTGVDGRSETGYGVYGVSGAQRFNPDAGVTLGEGYGVYARGRLGGTALLADARTTPPVKPGLAGDFFGGVRVVGDLEVTGHKPFKIDHPLDPPNKYLLHNAVESSEMKNVYDGVAQLDEAGTASVDLPEWFEALNGDFRYQLTAVGGAAPNLHVAEEIYENNRFKIAGGEGGMKVCWQVTGTRTDRWAAANPFVVEQEKPQEDRGLYLHPDLYGAPEEQSVIRTRMGEERLREEPPSYEPPQAPEMPPSYEPPQPPVIPPGVAAPGFGRLEEEHRQQIDELRGQIEELRRGRLEEEIDELKRQIKKLRRRR